MAGTDEIVSNKLPPSATVPAIIVVFISIALFNVLELLVKTFGTFKKYSGLYFWSVLVATIGIAFNSVGYLTLHLELTPWSLLYATLILIGWCTMITGQSMVMYSRIHLVVQQRKLLRAVLIMIIANAIWLHIPIIVLVYGMNSSNPEPFENPYDIYEKIQLTVFILQESIISGIYVWKTIKILQLEKAIRNVRTRRVLNHLIYVNLLIILLDLSILSLEYANQTTIQTAWKPLVYSVKLKMEFSILNRLVELVKPPSNGGSYTRSDADHVHQRGVALVTFEEERRRQHAKRQQEFDTGYSAHIGVGKGHQGQQFNDSTVLKTTEVQVHTQDRRNNVDDESISLDRKSGLTVESGREMPPERGRASSASSSEIQFARSQA